MKNLSDESRIHFKELEGIGNLYLEYIFYEYDGEPILFTCLTSDKERYLCSNCKLGVQWVIGRIGNEDFLRMLRDEVTLRDTFFKCENNRMVYCEKVSTDPGCNDWVVKVSPTVSTDTYPVSGEYLDLQDRIGDIIKSIEG